MGPRDGWGRRIRTPATWSRATRPTTRRSPNDARITAYTSRQVNAVRRNEHRKARAHFTADFSERLGRNLGTRAGGILMLLPVRGSRPLRAARRVTTNVPKPLMVTFWPRRSDSTIDITKVFMARSAEALELPDVLAMTATSSALVIRYRLRAAGE